MAEHHYTLQHFYIGLERQLRIEIETEKDEFIMGADPKELADYYSGHCFDQLELYEKDTITANFKKGIRLDMDGLQKKRVDIANSSFDTETVLTNIHFHPNRKLDVIKQFPLPVSPGCSIGWKENSIQIAAEWRGQGFFKTEEQIAGEILAAKELVMEEIKQLNIRIANLNEALKGNIRRWIDTRRGEIVSNQQRYEALLQRIAVPLEKKQNDVLSRIRLQHKPIVARVRPTPHVPEEYVLDRWKVLDVVAILDGYGRQMEKTPKTFCGSREEDLRNIFLVGLNGLFEGRATGETFSNKGKSDIYLNIDKGNILVCECKWWRGGMQYAGTIDQLLGYLTWRHNYGLIITFCGHQSVSNAVKESKKAVNQHGTFEKTLEGGNTAHFISLHKLPSDASKKVELHHLFYHLYGE